MLWWTYTLVQQSHKIKILVLPQYIDILIILILQGDDILYREQYSVNYVGEARPHSIWPELKGIP